MNCYSRRVDSDGVVPAVIAEKRWGKKVLAELCSTDAVKPLVFLAESDYVIRDYAEHQQTKADRELLVNKRSEAGRSGAQKRWQTDSKPIASAIANAKQTDSKPIAESESESELTRLNNVSYLLNREGEFLDDENLKNVREATFAGIGITNPKALHALLVKSTSRDVSEVEAFGIILDLLSKATGEVKNPQAYVAGAIKNSWAELQQVIDEGAVA